jgi:hypothetical protein
MIFNSQTQKSHHDITIRDYNSTTDESILLDYDNEFFPTPRPNFTRLWVNNTLGARRWTVVAIQHDTSNKNNRNNNNNNNNNDDDTPRSAVVVGYGVIRYAVSGCKIGPLFANDEHIAYDLFQALVQRVTTTAVADNSSEMINVATEIYMNVPESNAMAKQLAHDFGLESFFEIVQMYRGKIPSLPWNRTYGSTSYEVG